MLISVKAALCAAVACVAAVPAAALTFVVDTAGTLSFAPTMSNPALPSEEAAYRLTYSIPDELFDGRQVNYEREPNTGFRTRATYTSTGGFIRLIDNSSTGRVFENVSVEFSGDLMALRDLGSYRPGSSTVAFVRGTGVAGYNESFTGTVSRVTLLSDSDGDAVGLRSIAAVPEPTTWVLMLTAFGMAAYALRRRKAAVAVA